MSELSDSNGYGLVGDFSAVNNAETLFRIECDATAKHRHVRLLVEDGTVYIDEDEGRWILCTPAKPETFWRETLNALGTDDGEKPAPAYSEADKWADKPVFAFLFGCWAIVIGVFALKPHTKYGYPDPGGTAVGVIFGSAMILLGTCIIGGMTWGFIEPDWQAKRVGWRWMAASALALVPLGVLYFVIAPSSSQHIYRDAFNWLMGSFVLLGIGALNAVTTHDEYITGSLSYMKDSRQVERAENPLFFFLVLIVRIFASVAFAAMGVIAIVAAFVKK